MTAKISVVIPVYNSQKTIQRCLESIFANTHPNFDVIVVNDASQDRSCEIAGGFPCKIVNLDENRGPAYARQAGVNASEGEIVAFLDSDCTAPADWLEKIYKKLSPEIAGIGGMYVLPENINFISRLFTSYWDIKNVFHLSPFKTISLYGGNSAFWKSILLKQRKKSELVYCNKRVGGDDTLLCYELSQFGPIVYDPDIYVVHNKNISLKNILRESIMLGYSGGMVASVCGWSLAKEPQRAYKTILYLFSIILAVSTLFLPFSHTVARNYLLLVSLYVCAELPLMFLYYKSFAKNIKIIALPAVTFICDIFHLLGHCKRVGDVILRKVKNITWKIRCAVNILKPNSLSRLILFVTKKCNANCDFCFNKNTAQIAADELSPVEINNIAKGNKFLPWLTITGGEPFLRNDLHLICKSFYENSNTRNITIVTNGSMPLIVESTVEKIFLDAPDIYLTVAVALDHINELHDQIKGLEGSYDKAAHTIQKLNDLKIRFPGLRIGINTILNNENEDHISHIAKHFRENFKFSYHAINPLRTVPRQPANKKYIELIKTFNQRLPSRKFKLLRKSPQQAFLEECCDSVVKSNGRSYVKCRAVSKFLVINNEGSVLSCELLAYPISNLRENSYNLNAIKNSIRAKKIKKDIRATNCYCQWPCAVTSNVAFNKMSYMRILKKCLTKKGSDYEK